MRSHVEQHMIDLNLRTLAFKQKENN